MLLARAVTVRRFHQQAVRLVDCPGWPQQSRTLNAEIARKHNVTSAITLDQAQRDDRRTENMASGNEADVVTRVVAGESIGTLFPATASQVESRKRWLLSGTADSGGVLVAWWSI